MTIESENAGQTAISNEHSLLSFLREKITTWSDRELTIICAGHFMLIPGGNKEVLVPGIFAGDQDDHQAKALIGEFPQYSWMIGCSILKKAKAEGKPAKLSLLVNDWQMVPADPDREKSQPNRYRDFFYKSFKALPAAYQKTLQEYQLSFPSDIYQTEDGEFFLREVRLRDRFLRKLKTYFAKAPSVPLGTCNINENEAGNISLDRGNECFTLSTNSGAGCAGGVAQMLFELGKRHSGAFERINFINLMPKSCTLPVNVASELAMDMLLAEKINIRIDVLNIYFDTHALGDVLSAGRTYFPKVNCYEFKSEDHA